MHRCPPNTHKWTSNEWAAFRAKRILTELYKPEGRKVWCGFRYLLICPLLTTRRPIDSAERRIQGQGTPDDPDRPTSTLR